MKMELLPGREQASILLRRKKSNNAMKVSPAKENILKKIRQALTHSTPLPFPQSEGNSSVFQPSGQELEIEFAEQFTKLLGKFIFCVNHQELAAQLKDLVNHMSYKNI